ncbi:radical SAM protein [Chloroflexota bacterium]
MAWTEIKKIRERLSREQGAIVKDWGGKVPVALVYPNSYYVGMSNLGVHAIYKQLNDNRDFVGERVFWEKENRADFMPPLSLESQRPLTDFAAIAFSINYELDYFHVVHILKASGIPLFAAERDERYPLLIAGGPSITANPAPLVPFFDCLCIGEAEPIIPSLLPVLSQGIGCRRDSLLKDMAALPGVYVPQFYDGVPIVRQWVANLDDFPVSSVVLTRDTELGNLYLIEVERGCNRGCNFCMVSRTFSPMRYRSLDSLLAQAETGLKARKRVGLVGPAVSDHPQIEELIVRLRGMGVGISISSLRVSPISQVVLTGLAEGGARTVTMAPEAGSERLRRVIKKGISTDDILHAVELASECGMKQIKLYFIIGLPTETDEDAEDIAVLMLKAKDIVDKQRSGCRLNINIAPFVPKAGTPFQWLSMEAVSVMEKRLSLIKKRLRPAGITVKNESPAWSEVQGVLSRGDNRLTEVLVSMEQISLAGWRKAIQDCGLDVDYYARREWGTGESLPWDMLEIGTKSGQLEKALQRALTCNK